MSPADIPTVLMTLDPDQDVPDPAPGDPPPAPALADLRRATRAVSADTTDPAPDDTSGETGEGGEGGEGAALGDAPRVVAGVLDNRTPPGGITTTPAVTPAADPAPTSGALAADGQVVPIDDQFAFFVRPGAAATTPVVDGPARDGDAGAPVWVQLDRETHAVYQSVIYVLGSRVIVDGTACEGELEVTLVHHVVCCSDGTVLRLRLDEQVDVWRIMKVTDGEGTQVVIDQAREDNQSSVDRAILTRTGTPIRWVSIGHDLVVTW